MAVRGKVELELYSNGFTPVGVDEVGRGCLAGPVYACAVILDYAQLKKAPKEKKDLIRDSKTLSRTQRENVKSWLGEFIVDHGLASASVGEIEIFGIANATYLAMKRALSTLSSENNFGPVLVDGNQKIRGYNGDQQCLVGGDMNVFAIAAASILAKIARDHYMFEQAKIYPEYAFERHVGYGTAIHLQNIATHGICSLHRRNFAPIRKFSNHEAPVPTIISPKIPEDGFKHTG